MIKVAEPKVPADLHKVLATTPKVKVAWESLTPIAQRDFISWIEAAKKPETRTRRINIAYDKLLKGDRRPCCYAVVPMNLYKTLTEMPKAKAVWKSLTPDERRDFVGWIDEADNKVVHGLRIKKACVMLAKGMRHH